MKTLLNIDGMSCAHCVESVKKALEAVPGVKSAKVNLKDKTAQVDHGDDVSEAVLKTAVENAGFEVGG